MNCIELIGHKGPLSFKCAFVKNKNMQKAERERGEVRLVCENQSYATWMLSWRRVEWGGMGEDPF
jgi:hypothetical protein